MSWDRLDRISRGAGEIARLVRLHARPTLRRPDAAADPSGIVVTLTTIPSRIRQIFPALNSLLDQTVLPDRILLALPERSVREQSRYTVPDELEEHPRITVLRSDRDWGPATKLIPALLACADAPDTSLLAVDDDNVYPRTFVETFQRFAGELPDAALSGRGCGVPASLRWHKCREFLGTTVTTPKRTDIVEGCGGILVRPRFFDETLWDYDPAPARAFFVDDIWVSGHLARRKVPRYVIPFPGPFVYLPTLATYSGPMLDRDENRSGHNNDVVMAHFAPDWPAS